MSGRIVFGMNLKKERKRRRLTQQELADRIGVSRQTLSRYEKGHVDNIPFDTIDDICFELNITNDALFTMV